MGRMTAFTGLFIALSISSAWADIIVARTDPTQLGANDHVTWDQLGSDGSTIGQTFSATSSGGTSVGGSFTGSGGVVCNQSGGSCGSTFASDYFNGDAPAFGTATSVLARAGDPYGTGSGPLTFSFASGVSAIGSYVLSDVAFQNPNTDGSNGEAFTAVLSLYNGTTLLGTVSATSSDGSPVYLGATDSTGANITKAVYSLTSIGTEGLVVPPSYVSFSYDPFAGHSDPFFCASLTQRDLTNPANALRCPQLAYGYNAFPSGLSYDAFKAIANYDHDITVTFIGGGTQHADTDPDDLAAVEVGSLDLVVAPQSTVTTPVQVGAATVPEPASWALMILGAGAIIRRRSHRMMQDQTDDA